MQCSQKLGHLWPSSSLENITAKFGMNLSIYKEKLTGNAIEKSIGIVSFN